MIQKVFIRVILLLFICVFVSLLNIPVHHVPVVMIHSHLHIQHQQILHVTATAYNKDDGSEWCHHIIVPGLRRHGNMHATKTRFEYICGNTMYMGGMPYVGAIAVSHDLKYLMGHTVYIRGYRYRVMDLMGRPWHRRVDIYETSIHAARQWGVQLITLKVQ
jgi:3D (Asp-Asp-Asp) domain-containing protein